MRTLQINSTSGIARLFGSRVFLTLLLLSASTMAIMVPAVAHGDDSPSIAAEVLGTSEVTVSASDGVSDTVAASEVAAPGTRIFVGNLFSAPVLMLMLLVIGVFAYRKKLSKQTLDIR